MQPFTQDFLLKVKLLIQHQLDSSGRCSLCTNNIDLLSMLKGEFSEFETVLISLETIKQGFLFIASDDEDLWVMINDTINNSETQLQLLLIQQLKSLLPKDTKLKTPLLN